MAHRTLVEQYYVIDHATGALRETAASAPAGEVQTLAPLAGPHTVNAPHTATRLPDPVPPPTWTKRLREHTRAAGNAVMFTLRAVGAIVGITIASMSVLLLVALQRILRLG